jgi:hypothetical protein
MAAPRKAYPSVSIAHHCASGPQLSSREKKAVENFAQRCCCERSDCRRKLQRNRLTSSQVATAFFEVCVRELLGSAIGRMILLLTSFDRVTVLAALLRMLLLVPVGENLVVPNGRSIGLRHSARP